MEAVIWMVAIVVLIVIELLTMGLTTIWFVGGAFLAFLVALFNGPIWLQITVFIVASVCLLICTRPLAVKYFNKDRKKTNIDSLIGRECKVIERIDNFNQTGAVLLSGQEWTARSFVDNTVLEPGDRATVREIKGVKLIVSKSNKKSEL